MPLAVIRLDFDPFLRWAGLALRLETLGIALAVLVGLLLAARGGRRSHGPDGTPSPAPARDLLFIAVAAVPGALLGGRLGYGFLHADYYGANPALLLDPSTGGFELGLAVVGGIATAALFVAVALATPVSRWLQAAALPLLVTLGLAKLASVLGGTGQGSPWEGPFATAYAGPGPWGSLDPGAPAWPGALVEAFLVLLGAVMLAVLVAPEPERSTTRHAPLRILGISPAVPDGRAIWMALWIWGAARLFAAFSWRDAAVLGPLRADQLISLAIVALSTFGFVVAGLRGPALTSGKAAAPEAAGLASTPPTPKRARPAQPLDPDDRPVRKRRKPSSPSA